MRLKIKKEVKIICCVIFFWIVGTLRLHRAILHTKLCICVYIYIAEQHTILSKSNVWSSYLIIKKNFTCIFNSFTKSFILWSIFTLFLIFVYLKNEKKISTPFIGNFIKSKHSVCAKIQSFVLTLFHSWTRSKKNGTKILKLNFNYPCHVCTEST